MVEKAFRMLSWKTTEPGNFEKNILYLILNKSNMMNHIFQIKIDWNFQTRY